MICTQNITARYYYGEQFAGSACISMDSIPSLSSLVICRRTRERHAENTPCATDNVPSPREFKISGPHTCVYTPRAFHSSTPLSRLASPLFLQCRQTPYTHTHTYSHMRMYILAALSTYSATCELPYMCVLACYI